MCIEVINYYHLVLILFTDSLVPALLGIMASMPFGMHAAQKVRQSMNVAKQVDLVGSGRAKDGGNFTNFPNVQYADQAPSKYCDKMMNSIWGLYNRYSVHNFKSMTAAAGSQPQPSVQQQLMAATKDKSGQDWALHAKSSLDGMMKMKF